MNNPKYIKLAIAKKLLAAMALGAILSLAVPAADLVPFSDITPAQASALIKTNGSNPLFKIIDVRTDKEFTANCIKGALNIDIKAPDFKIKIVKLKRKGVYLVYCRSGARSGKAMNLMKEFGFKQVYNLAGGLIKWQSEKLPLEGGLLQIEPASNQNATIRAQITFENSPLVFVLRIS